MLELHLRDRVLTFERPLVMGIVNVTPDSFSDGGRHNSTHAAISHALTLVEQGADILDIGGESSRPGATPVPLDEELRRVVPVVQALAVQTRVPISVDTYKAEVASAVLGAGAHIINDITAMLGDPKMGEVVRDLRAGVVLMHMQGTPETMQANPRYENAVLEVGQFLEARLQAAVDLGIARERIALDPGIGFGKKERHNLQILAHLDEFQKLGRPVCLGASRKGIIGRICGRPVEQRLAGSLAITCHSLVHHSVQIVRVHDVEETLDAVMMISAIDEWAKESGS